MMLELLFFLSLGIVLYVYSGYLIVLGLLRRLRRIEIDSANPEATINSVTVLLTVHNEESQVRERIENVFNCSGADKLDLQVLVASDRSDDETNAIVERMQDPRVLLVKCKNSVGKSEAQNEAMQFASGDIIVFSDADTRFSVGFLCELLKPFNNLSVGAVDGHLLFGIDAESGTSKGHGYYWEYELKVRELESDLGLLAVASGGCLAVRKALIKKIPSDVGEDCIVPLDVVLQGYKVVHASKAVAYDQMDSQARDEFRARVRMTLRNWTGTWRRAALLNPCQYPGYAFALWSHKTLRWLSPFFLVAMAIAILFLATSSFFWTLVALLLGAFYIAGILGWVSEARGWRIPLVRTVFSFLLANLGFLVGVLTAVFSKKRITSYR